MSTDLDRSPSSASPVDRLVGRVLDRGGVSYGDEQERLRLYESSTVVATLQAVLVPWTLLACALLGGRAVAGVVLAVTVAYVLPWFVGSAYVRRRHVRVTPPRYTTTWVVTTLLTCLPYPFLFLALTWQFTRTSDHGFAHGFWWGAVGGAVAGAVALVVGMVRTTRQERRSGPAEDDE